MSTTLAPPHPTGGTPDADVAEPRTTVPSTTVQRMRREIRSLVRRARALISAAEASVELDLDTDTFEVLAHVVTREPARPAEIAELLLVDQAAARRHLIELAQLGLITRVAHASPPAYVPTAMGRRVHGAGADAATRALEEILESWTPAEVETLTRLLARLNGSDRQNG